MSTNLAEVNTELEPKQHTINELSLVQLLHDNGIRGIMWKGRPLGKTAQTDGDIDVLVHSDDKAHAESLLRDLGFHFVANSPWRNQPHVGDWYCVENAKLVHVQLYDQLVLGSYATPQILVPNANVVFDDSNTYTSDEVAAVLRICRATLHSRLHPGKTPDRLIGEARQLADQAETIYSTAEVLFDRETAEHITKAYQSGDIKSLKTHLLDNFRSPDEAGGIGLVAHIKKFASNINRRMFGLPVLSRRALNKPAPIIALIGSDGSGKSTAASVSSERLGEKLDTKFIYFGTGDGTSSLLRLPLVFLKSIREKRGTKATQTTASNPEKQGSVEKNKVPGLAKAAWAISVALERRSKMKQAKKHAAAGIIVITDRYPQNEFPGIHDGPRLDTWLSSAEVNTKSLKYKLAKWEQRIYDQLASDHPDLVILLDIDLENASLRRPEELVEDLERRIAIARELKFDNTNKVVISAIDPIDVVHDKTMQTILEAAVSEN